MLGEGDELMIIECWLINRVNGFVKHSDRKLEGRSSVGFEGVFGGEFGELLRSCKEETAVIGLSQEG